jgi:hypothetical protein
MPEAGWDEIRSEIDERYGPGIVGLRVDGREVRFANRHDESTFRLVGPDGDDGLWVFEERVHGDVIRAGLGRGRRTALANYETALETGRSRVGP